LQIAFADCQQLREFGRRGFAHVETHSPQRIIAAAVEAKAFPAILRAAQSIDVTSWGMRILYRHKYGVQCFALYLHIAALPQLSASRGPRYLTIGHIGTLYHPLPFLRFVSAGKRLPQEQNRTLRISASPEMDLIAAQDREIFASHGDLSEESAIPLLAACDFLYAMYPAGRKYERFRRTSLPIKSSPIPPPTARSPAWSQNINLAPSAWLASKTISQVTFVPSTTTP
jgi:hypothetical protein